MPEKVVLFDLDSAIYHTTYSQERMSSGKETWIQY